MTTTTTITTLHPITLQGHFFFLSLLLHFFPCKSWLLVTLFLIITTWTRRFLISRFHLFLFYPSAAFAFPDLSSCQPACPYIINSMPTVTCQRPFLLGNGNRNIPNAQLLPNPRSQLVSLCSTWTFFLSISLCAFVSYYSRAFVKAKCHLPVSSCSS